MTEASIWGAAPMPPVPLIAGAVHVWRASTDVDAARLVDYESMLDEDERVRSARFRRTELAGAFIAGRGIAREILGRYLGVGPAALRFQRPGLGKPALAPPHEMLHFNTSNSGGTILVAVTAGRRVGVDLEAVRPVPRALAVAERLFSQYEQDTLRGLSAQAREIAFLECWTRKEAFIKALGGGVWTGFDAFEVTCGPGEPAALRAIGGSAAEAARWTLRSLYPGAGYLGAVVVEGPLVEMETFAFV